MRAARRLRDALLALVNLRVLCTTMAGAALCAGAHAENRDTLEFDATSGTPITTVKVGEETFRFALDPLLGPFVSVNPAAQARVKVGAVREDGISAGLDGAQIKGVLGRMRLTAAGRTHTIEAALINRDHLPYGQSERYDMAGGFEALPARTIIVHLNRSIEGPMREITFARSRLDPRAGFPISIADTPMRINVHFANRSTWLDRRAAEVLMQRGLVKPTGEVSRLPVWYGLQMPVQRIEPLRPITLKGIPLNRLQARTSEPLVLPEPDENVILVQGLTASRREPLVLLGSDTLQQCAKLTFDRRRRTLTITCPAQD